MPSPTRRPAAAPQQLVALAALLVAVVAALVLVAGEVLGEPSVREQYGGHGGKPQIATGAVGRVALDARWHVATDDAGTGESRGLHRGDFEGRAVRLPHVPNAGRITGQAGVRSFEGSVAWYRTRLRVPETGRYAIRFESVNHRADVWIDGKHVGEHTGVYLPFEIRPRLEGGRDHTLVVRADWRDPAAMKASGWHRAWFNYGGINREVTIRPVGGPEVASAAVRTRLVGGGTARVDVSAVIRGGERARLSGTLVRGDQRIALRFEPGRTRTTVRIPRAALWAPGRPALYDLELRVGGKPSWRGRVGLRSLRRDGSRILLNDRPLRLHGASLHEDLPGRGDGLRSNEEAQLVADLRTLGANATRAQHALSPSLLEKLDAAGILVWLGVGPVDAPGAWTSRGERLVRQARVRVRRSLAQLQTHPSILAWNLANEAAGQGHPAGQAAYIDAMARELKERDPGRLVALDIWGSHPPRWAGPMYTHIDAIGWTNYLGWYEEPYASPERLERLIRTKLGALRRVFPDKAIAVTEFGAEGSHRNPTDDPGGFGFQARVLRTHLRTYARVPDLAGMLVWNLRDFGVAPSFGGGSIRRVVDRIVLVPGLNEKGLFTYGGEPKLAAEVVKQEFRRLRAGG